MGDKGSGSSSGGGGGGGGKESPPGRGGMKASRSQGSLVSVGSSASPAPAPSVLMSVSPQSSPNAELQPVVKKPRFVDVANARSENGADAYFSPTQYVNSPNTARARMQRSKSHNFLSQQSDTNATSPTTPRATASVENQFTELQTEIAILKRKLKLLEGTDMWGLRYSRRAAILANLWVGAILFASTFFEHIRSKRNTLFQVVVPGAIGGRKSKIQKNPIGVLLSEGTFYGLQHSWAFFLAAFLLMRSVAWKRFIGIMVSSGCSLYLAAILKFLPWMNYFNLFTNLIYVTAAFHNTNPDRTPTLTDYLFTRLDEEQ